MTSSLCQKQAPMNERGFKITYLELTAPGEESKYSFKILIAEGSITCTVPIHYIKHESETLSIILCRHSNSRFLQLRWEIFIQKSPMVIKKDIYHKGETLAYYLTVA